MFIFKEGKKLGNFVIWFFIKKFSVFGKLDYFYGEMLVIVFYFYKVWESVDLVIDSVFFFILGFEVREYFVFYYLFRSFFIG